MIYKIDAKGKKLGRIASEAAHLLMGKNEPDFARNKLSLVQVEISNASKINVTEKKKKTKEYITYSGYPGGIKSETLEHRIAKKGLADALREAVEGMLPKNKLKSRMLKLLKISE